MLICRQGFSEAVLSHQDKTHRVATVRQSDRRGFEKSYRIGVLRFVTVVIAE